jgi:hypothetical protein
MKVGFTLVDNGQRIRLAIEFREVHLLEPGRVIIVVFTHGPFGAPMWRLALASQTSS